MRPNEPDFDSVAYIYRCAEYASLGPLLQIVRTHLLPELCDRRHAMVLGDGDGRFLARLTAENPALRTTAVDTSAKMLNLLRRNCVLSSPNSLERLTLLHTSALETLPLPETDLIVSNFFFDCLQQSDVDALVQSYAAKLNPGTLWLISDFALPTVAWLRPLAAAYIRMLYLAFRLLTGLRVTRLPDIQHPMLRAGFAREKRQEWLKGLVYTEIWRLGKIKMVDRIMNANEKPAPERSQLPFDALPDPEPAAPSLPEPDLGVYHHTPAALPEENCE